MAQPITRRECASITIVGPSDYEAYRTYGAEEKTAARLLLGANDLIAAIGHRFNSARDLTEYLREHGITGSFWSEVGN